MLEETLRKFAELDALQNVPVFRIAPPVRCFYHDVNSPRVVCGELATRVRRGRTWIEDQFFCAEHAWNSDRPIAGDRFYRRVRFHASVLMAGCSLAADIAHAEALHRLEAAVAAAGGLLELDAVQSAFGRSSPSPEPALVMAKAGLREPK